MIRGQRSYRRRGEFQFTAKTLLLLLAALLMIGSAAFWWSIQRQLTGNAVVAATYTLIMVAAPPILTSFLIPWSPGGMLLQRINARTVGYGVVIAIAMFLLYYSYTIQVEWWSSQPTTSGSNMVFMQALIGIIGFILVPALSWTPVSGDELVEQIRQSHLVRRYELQTQADIAILRATLLRAQEKALVGFANLTAQEREELAQVMHGLVTGIDRTLKEIGRSVEVVSGATVPFDSLEDNEEIRSYLDYVHESLTSTSMVATTPQVGDGYGDFMDEEEALEERPQRLPARQPQLGPRQAR
jgi:hypothetical protein